LDTGINSLVAIARLHQIPADASVLKHEFSKSGSKLTDIELILAARSLSLKARKVKISLSGFDKRLLPVVAKMKDGNFIILAATSTAKNISEHQAKPDEAVEFLVHDFRDSSPKSIPIKDLEEMYTGETFVFSKRERLGFIFNREFNLSWFIPSIIKYKKLFGEVIIASFFLQLFALITPIFFQVVMDKVLVHRGFTTLNVLAIGFFIIIVCDALIGGIRNYIFSHTTNRIDVELGARLFKHVMKLPLSYFESRQVGQNVARIRELDTIREFITGTALTLIIDLLLMWFYSPKLTLVVLATIPAYVMLSILITPILRKNLEEKFHHGATNTAFLTESISGASTVKSLSLEPQMVSKLESHLSRYVKSSFKSQNINNIANQLAGFINKLMTLGIIYWGAHLVISGYLTVGQLVAFNMLASRISSPVLKLVQLWQDFQQAGISMARLGDILNTPQETNSEGTGSILPKVNGVIEFKNVSFRYGLRGPRILEGLNLTISHGDVVGVVGKSGSGKSTITKLIQRLYPPESGQIMIDSVDIRAMDIVWLRRQIGVVLQEDFLFNRSIRDNIAIVDPSLPLERIIASAKMAGAHEFISELVDGYETIVGEHGSNLSGGQRQRLAIARALINNPQILIMDEATSALDYESEKVIQSNMASICRGRTVIIIAHRISALKNCNKIIVMEKGSVTEQGSHRELLSKSGYYSRLYAAQNPNDNNGNVIVSRSRNYVR